MTGWWLIYPSEKYEFVNWDDELPNIWKNNKCSKPPTRIEFLKFSNSPGSGKSRTDQGIPHAD